MKEINTQEELETMLGEVEKVTGIMSEQEKKEFCCKLVGHSRIIVGCFGYIHCARCDEQMGDCLGGSYDTSAKVVVGHKCPTCIENEKLLTWKDLFMCPDPFAEEEGAEG